MTTRDVTGRSAPAAPLLTSLGPGLCSSPWYWLVLATINVGTAVVNVIDRDVFWSVYCSVLAVACFGCFVWLAVGRSRTATPDPKTDAELGGWRYGHEDDVYGSCSCGETRKHRHAKASPKDAS